MKKLLFLASILLVASSQSLRCEMSELDSSVPAAQCKSLEDILGALSDSQITPESFTLVSIAVESLKKSNVAEQDIVKFVESFLTKDDVKSKRLYKGAIVGLGAIATVALAACVYIWAQGKVNAELIVVNASDKKNKLENFKQRIEERRVQLVAEGKQNNTELIGTGDFRELDSVVTGIVEQMLNHVGIHYAKS